MFKNIVTLFSGSIISQLIPFIFLPLVSHLYKPEDFGFFSTIMAVVSILLVVSMLRYEQAIIQIHKVEELNSIFFYCLFFLMFSTFLVTVVTLFFFDIDIYFLIPFVLFFYGVNILFEKVMNSLELYKLMSTQKIIKSITEAVISIGIGYYLHDSYGLAYGLIAGLILSTVYVYFKLPKVFGFSNKVTINVLKNYIDFPKYNLPHATITSLISYLPILVIPFYYGYEELGYYAFGLKVIQTPLTLISSSASSVIAPMVYRDKINNDYSAFDFIVKIFKWQLLSVFVLLALLLSPAFPYVFKLVFSDDWSKSIEYVEYMLPVILLTFIVGPYACIINIFGKQKKALFIEFGYSLIKLSAVYLFANQEIEVFIMAFSIASSACLVISFFWYYSILNKNYKHRIKQ